MKSANQTSALYPIIRRIRRPLLPVDPPAESKPVVNNSSQVSEPIATDTSPEGVDEKKTNANDSSK